MQVRRIVVMLFSLGAALLCQQAVKVQSPVPSYSITDLGTLGRESYATAIDDSGHIVGYSRTSSGAVHAFSYRDGRMIDLGTLGGSHSRAYSVMWSHIAGDAQASDGNYHAVLFRSDGIARLGTLGGTSSTATDVNGLGDVVGSSATAGNAATRAFLYRNGLMTMLGDTFGGTISTAAAINNAGEVAGTAYTSGNLSARAFRFANGVTTDLGTLGGSSEATDINEIGDVVGQSRLAGNVVQHSFIYTGDHMLDIGGLGGTNAGARSVNNRREVVGWAQISGDVAQHAFLWRDGVMTDLNATIPIDSGWTLQSASGINDAGQIVGTGVRNGMVRAFLLTPPQDLVLSPGAMDSESNYPEPVQAGRTVRFTMTASVAEVEGQISPDQTVTVTDTVTGPVEIVSAETTDGVPCHIAGQTATCSVPHVGWGSVNGVIVVVRPTAAGGFSHTARVQGPATDPNLENNSFTEANTAISLASLTLTPATVAGGKASGARMTLTSPSRFGATVRLMSSNPTVVPVPSSFVVMDLTRSLNIYPRVVSVPTAVVISATYGLVTKTATLTVMPPVLYTFSISPTTVIGGCQTTTSRVSLTGSAPSTGASVAITENIGAANFPSSILVGAGMMTRSLSIPTSYVTTYQSGLVSANYGGVSKAMTLNVRPIRARTLTLSPNPVVGGNLANGMVTLECAAAPGPILVTLSSSNSALANPASSTITIPAGALSGAFTVRTTDVSVPSTVYIRARVLGNLRSTVLTLNP